MRKISFLNIVACMTAIIATMLFGVAGNSVKADVTKTVDLGDSVELDFDDDPNCKLFYEATKDQMIRIYSTGDADTKVHLYKDGDESYLAFDDNSGENQNFDLYYLLKKGTYYFQIRHNTSSNHGNMATIHIEDATDPTPVARFDANDFPDGKFRNAAKSIADKNGDGILTREEVHITRNMWFSGDNITSVKGIEYFTELENLSFFMISGLRSLDLTNNTKLKDLAIVDIPTLESVDLSKCRSLESMTLHITGVKSLDLKGSIIKELDCSNNTIAKLNLSGCLALGTLNCSQNQLTSLDLSKTPYLGYLYCSDNNLTELNINKGSSLYELYCDNNKLASVDLSDSPILSYIHSDKYRNADEGIYEATIGGIEYRLKIDEKTKITGTENSDDKVVKINETNFPDSLFRIAVTKKDNDKDGWLSNFEIARTTGIDSNTYTSVKGLEYLKYLVNFYLFRCEITELDFSSNTRLQQIGIWNTPVNSLDISKCTQLTTLYLINEVPDQLNWNLGSLNISNNSKLSHLSCTGTHLKALDVSKNHELNILDLRDNDLTTLDISNNPYLVDAYKNGKKYEYDENGIKWVKYQSELGMLIIDKNVVVNAAKKVTPTPTAKPTATPTAKPAATPTSAAKPTIAPTSAATPTSKPGAKATLTLDKKTANITCGKALTLKATLKGSSSKITWKSSNNKIATVDANGKVTSKMAGQVTITATAAGKSAKCEVTVLYKDVTNSKDFWYAPTNYLTAKDVVRGYDKQTKFKPANDCTRAQMVTFLYRLQGEPKVKSTTCKFKDVKKTDYFFKPIIWANENGITTGISKDKFGPQGVCTRAQTVTFLWRMAKKPTPKTTKNKFPDVKKSDYFYTATLWASEKKILAGLPDGTFNPQGKCLRRQMVTFLFKYDKFINHR